MTTQLERNLVSRKQLEDIRTHYNDVEDAYLDKYKSHYDGEYQDVFGKTPLNSEVFRVYGYERPFCYEVDVPDIDEKFVKALNDDLPQDNSWRQIMDTNKDNKLSTNEVRDFFDNFTNWTNKLTDNQLNNLFYLKNNALCLNSLFDNQEGVKESNVVDKSIITKNDFDMLDLADGKKDGIIQKNIFEKFDFDANKDGVIDYNEYQAGMQRVETALQNGTECDNCTANSNLHNTSTPEPEIG